MDIYASVLVCVCVFMCVQMCRCVRLSLCVQWFWFDEGEKKNNNNNKNKERTEKKNRKKKQKKKNLKSSSLPFAPGGKAASARASSTRQGQSILILSTTMGAKGPKGKLERAADAEGTNCTLNDAELVHNPVCVRVGGCVKERTSETLVR